MMKTLARKWLGIDDELSNLEREIQLRWEKLRELDASIQHLSNQKDIQRADLTIVQSNALKVLVEYCIKEMFETPAICQGMSWTRNTVNISLAGTFQEFVRKYINDNEIFKITKYEKIVQNKIDGEEFIDSIIKRIQKKQLS